jgi:exonuclease VII small subunit
MNTNTTAEIEITYTLDKGELESILDQIPLDDVIRHYEVKAILEEIESNSGWEKEMVQFAKDRLYMVTEDEHEDEMGKLNDKIEELENTRMELLQALNQYEKTE